jgi:organic hydroperoxide reductase OsmC/OhrA
MATYSAEVIWERGEAVFTDNRYSRRHRLRFDGGAEVPGSSSPHSVALPMSDPAAVDPEEALVGALASCHMLWFLSIAAQRGYRVDAYRDQGAGVLAKNADGQWCISVVTLRLARSSPATVCRPRSRLLRCTMRPMRSATLPTRSPRRCGASPYLRNTSGLMVSSALKQR